MNMERLRRPNIAWIIPENKQFSITNEGGEHPIETNETNDTNETSKTKDVEKGGWKRRWLSVADIETIVLWHKRRHNHPPPIPRHHLFSSATNHPRTLFQTTRFTYRAHAVVTYQGCIIFGCQTSSQKSKNSSELSSPLFSEGSASSESWYVSKTVQKCRSMPRTPPCKKGRITWFIARIRYIDCYGRKTAVWKALKKRLWPVVLLGFVRWWPTYDTPTCSLMFHIGWFTLHARGT
jgi:hypothetical protein